MDVFLSQYDWIRRTRKTLFRYCETLPHEDYVKEVEAFGGDSIRNLHAHVADCYQTWLGIRALGKQFPEINPQTIHSVQDMREIFAKTDDLVLEFLQEFKGNWGRSIRVTMRNRKSWEITALWLFTHTATHEFHHKGQIVKIGRQLGFIPPETDLLEDFIPC
ncbi:DinB family protein [Fictibacillus enclensis]|uniref:DinB family protein n=1 Tax=Fictibacillus enclensis TaxID=1017270 RepID=UPI0025A06539|nr:DinB family protein [Fictibacillus enclensis]MDM5199290.1 DinB family protein [Fictibacillus enclensis]